MSVPAPGSRDAATMIIFREQPGNAPKLLMMERAATLRFAAGALVFPGGAVDDDDRMLGESIAPHLRPDEAAARIAAIRETLEEAGLAMGFRALPTSEVVVAVRAQLSEGRLFSEALAEARLTLAPDDLVPFARWHPSGGEKVTRVFDTRFYLARFPESSDEPTVDATENVRLLWASATEVLERCAAGLDRAIFPTLRNLDRLAQFENFEAARDHANSIPIEKVTPWIEEREDGAHLCIPSHLGYPVTSQALASLQRG